MQTKAVRIISGATYNDDHTDPIFLKMSILKLEDVHVFDLNVAKYMYALNHGTLHLKRRKILINNHDIHSRNTINKLNPHIIMRRNNIACKNIRYDSSKIWYNIQPKYKFEINSFPYQNIEVYRSLYLRANIKNFRPHCTLS